MAKKLSTAEILAKARADAAKKSGDSAEPEQDAAAEQPAAEEQAAPEATPPTGDAPATPKSTADILAAARAQAAAKAEGEEAAPAAPTGGDAPKSTKDILAAARAQASGTGSGKPAAAPSSTKDILAAARAQAGGGAAKPSAPAAKGSEPKAGAKAAAPTTTASGEKLSVQEMLSRVREGKPTAAAVPAAPAAPTLPPRPQKPAAGKKGKTSADSDRRFWLVALLASPFAIGWALFTIASGAFTLAVARFMMPNVLIEPPSQFKIGPPSDYPPDTVSTKWKAQFGVWIVNTLYNGERMVYALSSVCTHLGCTPNWLEGEQKFKCPCHGSGFYINGINFEGPAPRPLERVGIQIAPDGMLEVDKSMKFQEEMGQWADTKSYVPVA